MILTIRIKYQKIKRSIDDTYRIELNKQYASPRDTSSAKEKVKATCAVRTVPYIGQKGSLLHGPIDRARIGSEL